MDLSFRCQFFRRCSFLMTGLQNSPFHPNSATTVQLFPLLGSQDYFSSSSKYVNLKLLQRMNDSNVAAQPSLCVVTSIGHNPSLCYYLGYVRILILEQFLPNHYVSDSTNKPGVEKVKVELYSESLCPYCANFIVNYLNPFFNNGIIDIVDLRIIPYGNAHVHTDGSMVCQHGQDECDLNIIQTCAIRLWPKVTDWFPFIYCLENLDRATAAQNWKSCVQPSGLDLAPLLECSTSPLGAKLELEFAAETDRLQPPHKYVPWVLVNGEPLYENYEDVATYVCKAYQGNKPAVCSRLHTERLEKTPVAGVCPKKDLLLASA